ncbi:MAG TPA: beta-propeller fold lactonase family protein, partial [Saprospiraceae bacterium]|nr:beta-propeller fold lactonase family protein [Saprospiraceae bacterium]
MMLSFLLSISTFLSLPFQKDSVYQMVVGSYTKNGNPGIEVFEVNANTGSSRKLYTKANPNASYLATTRDARVMYAVTEEGGGSSKLSAYKLDGKGEYQRVNSQSTMGDGPCFVSIRESSRTAYVANYSG